MLQRFAAAVRQGENPRCCSGLPRCEKVLQRRAALQRGAAAVCRSEKQVLQRFAAAVHPREKPPAYAAAGHRGKMGAQALQSMLFSHTYMLY